jgi:phenylacetate-CoA ligase
LYTAFLNNFLAPAWALHERSPYLRIAARLEKERHLTLDERLARQWREVRGIVSYAWDHSVWYRRRFAEAGFQPGDLKDWSDFRRLPLLTKQDIRDHRDSIVSRLYRREDLRPRSTSGSTGVSLQFFTDDACGQWKRGVELFRDRWTGWNLGDYKAMVWGNPPPWDTLRSRVRNRLLERMIFLDTLRMNERDMAAFVTEIELRRPTLLFGHAHSLFLFARYWRQHGLRDYRFKGVLSSAMVLHDFERAEIESVFGPCLFDRYGCEEVSLVASECDHHRGLHVNSDSLVVEVLPPAAPETGAAGPVVVTDLKNRGMPFIRYKVGDMAEEDPNPCPCGRTYPVLKAVAGRIADYILTPDGYFVSGVSLTENFATKIPGVAQMQIIQEERTRLILRMVRASDFGEHSTDAIRLLMAERFGSSMQASLEFVDRIPPEPSGKYRFSICRLPLEFPGDRSAS